MLQNPAAFAALAAVFPDLVRLSLLVAYGGVPQVSNYTTKRVASAEGE